MEDYTFIPAEGVIDAILDADLISFDCETKDPLLVEQGSGVYRKDGYVTGVAIGSENGATYLSLRHPDTPPEAREANERILARALSKPVDKVNANILYDLDWLSSYGYTVAGHWHDVQFAEPLLDEYRRSYSLASLALKYTNETKQTNLLEKYCEQMGWTDKKPAAHIWKMPSEVVARYATVDAALPIEIFKHQKLELERQNLWDLYMMETSLQPMLLRMRQQGVRLDVPKLERLITAVTEQHFLLKEKIYEWSGYEFNIGSSVQLAKIFDREGIWYPRNAPTERMALEGKGGNPKLDAESLTQLSTKYDICKTILKFRHFDTIINIFLHPYLGFHVNGRLHCMFNALRSDDYGTVSGRFSSSKPNLQQVSAKSEGDEGGEDAEALAQMTEQERILQGQIIRQLFIPEEGMKWAKADYSQVEYRITAHYALGPGSEELRRSYTDNPDTDYHKLVQDLTGFDRRTCKRLNFGGAYGMGVQTAARKFGWTMEEAGLFMEQYHRSAPYIKATRKAVSRKAERVGYIFTLLGRRARTHPSRALHSMFNRLIQGSAADIMKKAMVDCWQAGVFETLPPHLTVHDELDVSVPQTPEGDEALKEMVHLMEHAVHLSVPLRVDCHVGDNWAEAD